ncbi:unnamed protein product [[Candida] boidinii]|uniref:Endosomal/vacuolar adapter protein YPT35 n=1 Tax=Candida boidinii TaxID=5477 RepID=A0A9W6T531_CANBO|nr:hypothetical protein B5S30_g2917 [[Candida] boidinii]OWB82591.1 hypothetical protein B5S33_g1218 [[Candida] boidinii]GME78445.1 unnamed protein product [[Candida] boidinii]GMF49640.1 unnamed protein product [[Candida] boidinii]GMG04965.1 unnamed protein product [[Candida] boidinii]
MGGSKTQKDISQLISMNPTPITLTDNTNDKDDSSVRYTDTNRVNGNPSRRDQNLSDHVHVNNDNITHNGQVESTDDSDLNCQYRDNATQGVKHRLWCVGCHIGEPVIIKGNVSGGSQYVIWTIEFDTVNGSKIITRRRYSEFEELRAKLMKKYSKMFSIPELPGKTYLSSRFNPEVLEERRGGLEFFLSTVVMNPFICDCEEVKEFVMKSR